MGIEDLPAIRDLEQFADSLPVEMRGKIYGIARAFLKIGDTNGLKDAISTALNGTSSSNYNQFIEYFEKKRRENSR